MQGKILYLVRRAGLVVLSSAADIRVHPGETFIRANTVVRERFVGSISAGQHVTIAIPDAGLETPTLGLGRQYVFFLKAKDRSASNEAVLWSLLDGSSPLPIADGQVSEVSSAMREYARLAAGDVAEHELRQHLIRMLKSNVDFLRVDASRTAADYSGWTDAEIGALAERITGKDGIKPLSGNDRDNVIITIVSKASIEKVVPFARAQLDNGIVDPVYLGLFLRKGAGVDSILRSLLQSSEPDVQIGALRVAGLLRHADMIKEFDERHGKSANKAVRDAVDAAKALVDRD